MQVIPQAEQDYTACAMKVSTILPQSPLLPLQHMHTHIHVQYREFSRLRQLLADREKNMIKCTLQNNMRDSEEESGDEIIILKSSSKRKAVQDEEDAYEDLRPTKKMKKDDDSDYTLVSY